LGFYLDTLEDELLSLLASVSPQPDTQAPNHVEEREEEAPKENGWMEVGRRNRTVVTRTVRGPSLLTCKPNVTTSLRPPNHLSPAFSEVPSVLHFACLNIRTLLS